VTGRVVSEIVFVYDPPEGGYAAEALGRAILVRDDVVAV
jgi:hypothetical protein